MLAAIAREENEAEDLAPWHALQEWLSGPTAKRRVTIPYAPTLADLVPPVAVRLRRDFGAVLSLIRAHAVLHQIGRDHDEKDRLVATLEDYEAVRELVEDLVSEGVDATVSRTVRDTVAAVGRLCEDAEEPVSLVAVAAELGLDRSAASRRVRRATEQGYLKNLEDRRGKPARLTLGDPLPEDLRILPAARDLEALHRCTTEATQRCNATSGLDEARAVLPPRSRLAADENAAATPIFAHADGDRCTVAGENGGRGTPLPPQRDREGRGGDSHPSENSATVQHPGEADDGRERFTL